MTAASVMAFITFDAPVGPNAREIGAEPPPGRDLAAALIHGAEAAGYRVVEPLGQHDSYGWSFTVDVGDSQPVWCMLQLSDEWLLITHVRVPLLRRLFGGSRGTAAHGRLDSALVAAASALAGASNVQWFRTEDDLRQRRASYPGLHA